MRILHFTDRSLSAKAAELVQFDMDSIRQVVAGRHGQEPELWLSDPDQYERNGRVLRDSSSPRLLAYSSKGRTLYVTDGCNSCSHQLDQDLAAMAGDQIQALSEKTGIRLELLGKMAAIDRH